MASIYNAGGENTFAIVAPAVVSGFIMAMLYMELEFILSDYE